MFRLPEVGRVQRLIVVALLASVVAAAFAVLSAQEVRPQTVESCYSTYVQQDLIVGEGDLTEVGRTALEAAGVPIEESGVLLGRFTVRKDWATDGGAITRATTFPRLELTEAGNIASLQASFTNNQDDVGNNSHTSEVNAQLQVDLEILSLAGSRTTAIETIAPDKYFWSPSGANGYTEPRNC